MTPRRRLVVLGALLGASLVALHFRTAIQSVAWGREQPGHASAGQPAPEVPDTVRTLEGKPLRLQDLRGRVVLLHFWTFACSNCHHMLPRYSAWARELGPRGLSVVGAHTPELPEEFDEVKLARFVRESAIAWPVLVDSGYALWDRYGVHAWPTMVVIDRQGVVRGTFVGDDQAAPLEALLQKLLAQP